MLFKCLRFSRISSSNWILMSCQPHRVTSGHSNSGHKQIHISKLFPRIYQPSVKSIYKTNHFTNIKHTHTQTSDTNFRRVSPFNITPVKRAHKARTCWYRRPFRLIYRYQVKEKYQHTRELISARKTSHKRTQQPRPESPTVTLTWHARKLQGT